MSLEQAVAAPMCTCRLADAGARVIKIERPEGDFARYYDGFAHGECSYFVWLNRGKESVVLDLVKDEDKALARARCSSAPTYSCRISNRAPWRSSASRFRDCAAIIRADLLLDFRIRRETDRSPSERLTICSIQAETGLASITGTTEPSRVGVSVVDVSTGLNAYEAILEALIVRQRTGEGAELSVSMFDSVADWMTVPLLQHEAGKPPQRVGLTHPAIAPYGAFPTRDGAQILIGIQNDREWRVLAEKVLGDTDLAADPGFATNRARVERRAETDRKVAAITCTADAELLTQKLAAAEIAFAPINTVADLARHPHLRMITVATPSGPVSYPAPAERHASSSRHYRPVPSLGEHTAKVRTEFTVERI